LERSTPWLMAVSAEQSLAGSTAWLLANSEAPVLVAKEIQHSPMDHPILRFTPTG